MRKIFIILIIASILFPSSILAYSREIQENDLRHDKLIAELDAKILSLETEVESLRVGNQELGEEVSLIRQIVMTFQEQIIEIQKIVISFAKHFLGIL